MTQRSNIWVDVTFGLQLRQNLGGKLKISVLKCLAGTLQTRPRTRGVKKLDGLVAQRLVKSIGKFLRAGKTVPGLLRHAFVHDAADELAYRGAQFRCRGW